MATLRSSWLMLLLSLAAASLLFGAVEAQGGLKPRPLPRRPGTPVVPGRRQPLPQPRMPSPFQNAANHISGPAQGPGSAQPMPLPRHVPPGAAAPFQPRPMYPGLPGAVQVHPPPQQARPPPPMNTGPGGAPPGMVYCAPNEYYRPGQEMCCHREVVPMPYSIPPQYVQCCDGEVIDNRTEACCMGQERIFLGEQGCCGSEVFDVRTEMCCGRRVVQVRGRICCGGQLVPAATTMCCDGMPTPIRGDASQFMCCGSTAINLNTHICCGQKRPLDSRSELVGCCGNRMVYRKRTDSCCRSSTGRWMVRPGSSCDPPTTPPPPTANPAAGSAIQFVIGQPGLDGGFVQRLPNGNMILLPGAKAEGTKGANTPQPNGRPSFVLIPVPSGTSVPGVQLPGQAGFGRTVPSIPGVGHPGMNFADLFQPALPVFRPAPGYPMAYPITQSPKHKKQEFKPPMYPSELPTAPSTTSPGRPTLGFFKAKAQTSPTVTPKHKPMP